MRLPDLRAGHASQVANYFALATDAPAPVARSICDISSVGAEGSASYRGMIAIEHLAHATCELVERVGFRQEVDGMVEHAPLKSGVLRVA